MWVAISLPLAGGIAAAHSGKKKTERKHVVAFLGFIVAVILFFLWWFNRGV
ncbi:hypothetical protein [Rossellomorea vietnamensis]|uniref:Uncharacterized protein n=1 Tax=Rossellomorea vietnamensis TaxID=218284 RepID=A0ACD4CCR4_9BACI|nr:hypothetical protein [Rossellomorea vietnamensis]UXH46262.1 hypothetical protein N5C46_09525 [Rossellomorea vietnamensis]WQI97708.1 hypothetical protein Q7C14_10120 [Rossellomorea vietnamensis]